MGRFTRLLKNMYNVESRAANKLPLFLMLHASDNFKHEVRNVNPGAFLNAFSKINNRAAAS